MGYPNDLPDGIDRSQRIGHMSDRHEFCPRSQPLLKLIHQKLARLIKRNHLQLAPVLLTQQLPGHNVGMMFHSSDQDFISFFNKCSSVGGGHQVNAF